jgi:hypothetical protein
MSTFENKVEVVTEWLQRTARLQRVTNLYEVRVAAGLALAEKGYRENGSARSLGDETFDVLEAVAKESFAAQGLILPALMIHFGEKKPSSHFLGWAAEAGLIDPDAGIDPDAVVALAAEEIVKIHEKYANVLA